MSRLVLGLRSLFLKAACQGFCQGGLDAQDPSRAEAARRLFWSSPPMVFGRDHGTETILATKSVHANYTQQGLLMVMDAVRAYVMDQ